MTPFYTNVLDKKSPQERVSQEKMAEALTNFYFAPALDIKTIIQNNYQCKLYKMIPIENSM